MSPVRALLLLATAAALLAAAARPARAHDEAGASEGAAPASGSLYQLEGRWMAAPDRTLALAELEGRPVVLLLFYGTCESACPLLVHDVQSIESALAPGERDRVRFVLVTIDPDVDTPERLAAYAGEHGLAPERWLLLHGAKEQVRALAVALGVRYRPVGGGQFAHTQRITLLDRAGRVAEQWDGVHRETGPIVQRIRQEIAAAGS